jgi:hypothetical protein
MAVKLPEIKTTEEAVSTTDFLSAAKIEKLMLPDSLVERIGTYAKSKKLPYDILLKTALENLVKRGGRPPKAKAVRKPRKARKVKKAKTVKPAAAPRMKKKPEVTI